MERASGVSAWRSARTKAAKYRGHGPWPHIEESGMKLVDPQQDIRAMVDLKDLLEAGHERGYVTSQEIMDVVEEFDLAPMIPP